MYFAFNHQGSVHALFSALIVCLQVVSIELCGRSCSAPMEIAFKLLYESEFLVIALNCWNVLANTVK